MPRFLWVRVAVLVHLLVLKSIGILAVRVAYSVMIYRWTLDLKLYSHQNDQVVAYLDGHLHHLFSVRHSKIQWIEIKMVLMECHREVMAFSGPKIGGFSGQQ